MSRAVSVFSPTRLTPQVAFFSDSRLEAMAWPPRPFFYLENHNDSRSCFLHVDPISDGAIRQAVPCAVRSCVSSAVLEDSSVSRVEADDERMKVTALPYFVAPSRYRCAVSRLGSALPEVFGR